MTTVKTLLADCDISVVAKGWSASCHCDHGGKRVRGVCQPCYNAYSRNVWRQHNREIDRAKKREFRLKNSDKDYLYSVKKKYGLSAQDYYALLELQQSRCAICHTHQDEIGERLAVDHSHTTLEVRGLLCKACNQSLGWHEAKGTRAWSSYLAFPPMKELRYRRETPEDEQVHPY